MSFGDDTDDAGAFVDPTDPTDDELRAWAARDAPWPARDWHVALSAGPAVGVLMEIADDERYTAGGRWTMLSALYLRVGDAVRTGGRSTSFAALTDAVAQARRFPAGPVTRWADRTEALLRDPGTVEDGGWCDGRLAAQDIPA